MTGPDCLWIAALLLGGVSDGQPTWVPLTPTVTRSEGGAGFEVRSDGAVRVQGANPEKDVHVLEAVTDLERITGFRLEVLPDPELPAQGPGRAHNGNFVLSELKVEAASKVASHAAREIRLQHATASHSQDSWPVTLALDGNPDSGWAILPRTGKRSVLVAEAAEDLGFKTGTFLRITLSFQFGDKHTLGCYRLSVTGGDRPLVAERAEDAKEWAEVQGAINLAIDRGVDYLLDTQELDGSWKEHQGGYPTGQTALSLYTLLKGGVPKHHPAVLRAAAWLRNRPATKTYSCGCQILAFCALDDEQDRGRIQQLVDRMVGWQKRDGGYGYPDRRPDLSCTQYAALGLMVASERGYRVPADVWSGLADWTMKMQEEVRSPYEPAGFRYEPGAVARGSMTAAGVAVLTICEQQMRRKRGDIVQSRQRGLDWLTAYFSVRANVRSSGRADQDQLYYYLYGLERVGGLCDITHFGSHHWYREGAEFLLEKQNDKNGSWTDNQSNTCFAVLFLARATVASTGSVVRGRTTYGEDNPKEDLSLRAAGDTPLTLWVSSFGEGALMELEWPGDENRGPRVQEVRYYAYPRGHEGEPTLIESVAGDPGRPADGEKFAIQHEFPKPGRYTVYAELDAAVPHEADGSGAVLTLESKPVEVRIRETLDDTLLRYATDAARNLLLTTPLEVSATSKQHDDWGPKMAVDSLLRTGWLCADEDAAPKLTLVLEDPVRASTILLSHAAPEDKERTARIRKLRILLNGKGPGYDIEMVPDDGQKTEWEIPKAMLVRRIDLEILERTEGHAQKRGVGLAEIELQQASRTRKGR